MSLLADLSTAAASLAADIGHRIVAVRGGGGRALSGFIWRRGLVVTSEEGLDGEDEVEVVFDGGTSARAAIAEWRAYLERQQLEPQPELVEVLCWLERHAPTAQATVLVHGDWKPGNWLIDGDDIVVVLDWETAHLGDPLEDVGWVTNPLRHREHLIPGAWERADLFAAYEAIPTYQRILGRGDATGPVDVAVIGTDAQVRARLRRFADVGATDLCASVLGLDDDRDASRTATLDVLATL